MKNKELAIRLVEGSTLTEAEVRKIVQGIIDKIKKAGKSISKEVLDAGMAQAKSVLATAPISSEEKEKLMGQLKAVAA